MKRTRAVAKAKHAENDKTDVAKNEPETKTKDVVQGKTIQHNNLENKKLKTLKETDNQNNVTDSTQNQIKNVKPLEQKKKSKLNLQTLRDKNKKAKEEYKPNTSPSKNKPRAVVDLEMMKEELKQLEDPPLTPWEKEVSSAKLDYSFFDLPCEQLAQNLLGKVLVRCLENGTLLKGRIVETEAYLGTIDKASMTYQNRITPRNIPMYMSPGTIFVYMTYGMYHCFNISSQEPESYVQLRAVEPLLGLDYMELLRNMQSEKNGKEKQIVKHVRRIKHNELCNSPSKICVAFVIDEDSFNQREIYNCVGCAVLIRAVDPFEGLTYMANQRKSKRKSKKGSIDLKVHELCNGPSKLCMAYQLDRTHNKYSVCSWKGMWIENDNTEEEIKIVKSSRIGIDSSGPEWANKPLRYYVCGNKSVSKRDKKAEEEML